MSLMEVLIAMFVLSVGLLGVAALIPVGRLAIVETGKADRSGACGRAALSEIKVRQMLDYRFWTPGTVEPSWWAAVKYYNLPPAIPNPTPPPPQIPSLDAFAIDPLGVIRQMPANLGGAVAGPLVAVVPRITLKSFPSPTGPLLTFEQADRIFTWHDDLEFSLPKDIKPPPPGESKRPRANLGISGLPDIAGSYSWLVTVTPAAAEVALPVADKSLFSVSVVVCYRREFSASGEHTASVKFLGGGYGGGSVELIGASPVDPPLRLRENEWIMLCGKVGERTICKWYRVVSADRGDPTQSGNPTQYVSLLGPDWDTVACPTATAVAIDHVVGVYTTTVELDRNLLWNK